MGKFLWSTYSIFKFQFHDTSCRLMENSTVSIVYKFWKLSGEFVNIKSIDEVLAEFLKSIRLFICLFIYLFIYFLFIYLLFIYLLTYLKSI